MEIDNLRNKIFNIKDKTFATLSLGCRVNRAEIDKITSLLLRGCFNKTSYDKACLILINTCTVTHVADAKTRKLVRKVSSLNKKPNTIIIVSGCASEINQSVFKEIDKRILVVPKKDLKELFDNQDLDKQSFNDDLAAMRSNLKIQDGCNNNCSYCIVHVARGKAISYDYKKVLTEFRGLLRSGVKEIVLTGINLASYRYKSIDLAKLCRELVFLIDEYYQNKKDDVPARIRLSSLEPQDITQDFIQVLKSSNGKIARHLHLPLQSGSDKILKLMNRKYTRSDYFKLIDDLKSNIPQIALSTDVIVGFPNETEDDFSQTVDLCKKCGFMKIHVFPYSKRQGTPASTMSGQVGETVKQKRSLLLRDLSKDLQVKDLDNRKGNVEYVFIEKPNIARTESYHLINVKPQQKVGSLIRWRL